MHINLHKHSQISRSVKDAVPGAADKIPEINADQAIKTAIGYYHRGHLKRAATECEKILVSITDHPDALHLLGVIAHQSGCNPDAAKLIGRALQISPNHPIYHYSLANALKHQGKLNEAMMAILKQLIWNH